MQVTDANRHNANTDGVVNPYLILFEFSEDRGGTTQRAVYNNDDVEFAGNTYTGAAINISLPSSSDNLPELELSMSNVTRVLAKPLFLATRRIGARIMMVDTGASPYDLLVDTRDMLVVKSVWGNGAQLKVTLGVRFEFNEPVPFNRTTKQFFPGLWFSH